MINVSIIGANGYTGLQLMTLLLSHKRVTLGHLVSVSNAGKDITDLYPSLYALKGKKFEGADIDAIAADSDVVFTALPHVTSAEFVAKFYKKGVKVIDLSADFRYKDIDLYNSVYGCTHPFPELSGYSVYGLPEVYRHQIKNAFIVANPGCYTTCSILALYPALKEKLVRPDNIIIDAKSGTSGAGRKADTQNLFCEVNENFKAYAVTTHRHTSEIEQELSLAGGKQISLSFTPHLLPLQRGILSTCYANLMPGISGDDVYHAFKKHYNNEPFVIVNPEGTLPELKHVRGTNYASIGFKIDKRLNRVVIVSAIDNLIKGASGQAIQNMNLLFSLDETMGLQALSQYV